MDSRHNGPSRLSKPIEEPNNIEGSGRIQPGGGLIQEDDGRIDEQLNPDGCPLLLSPRDAPNERIAHIGIGTLPQPQNLYSLLHPLPPLLLSQVNQSHTGDKPKALPGRERREQQIFLHDIANLIAVDVHVEDLLLIDEEGTREGQVVGQEAG